MIGLLGSRRQRARAGRRPGCEAGQPGRARAPRARRGRTGRLLSRRTVLTGALLGGLLAALGIVALRAEGIRLRYRLGKAVRAEKALAEERRVLTARVRRLRDPKRLTAAARKLGFSPPTRVIALPASGAPPEAKR